MSFQVLTGDARDTLRLLADASVACVVTSPPYFRQRDYGVPGQIGLEADAEAYVRAIVRVMDEVLRVLKADGTLWLNLGDHYLPNKQLAGTPWRIALALQEHGWILRTDIIWAKNAIMPENVADRPTRSHEYLFLLAKSRNYFYNADAIREPLSPLTLAREARPRQRCQAGGGSVESMKGYDYTRKGKGLLQSNPKGRNKRSVWAINPKNYPGFHSAVFPEALVDPCILAGSRPGDRVMDPFCGSGTVGIVALRHGRSFCGIDLNPEYAAMAEARIEASLPPAPLPSHPSLFGDEVGA